MYRVIELLMAALATQRLTAIWSGEAIAQPLRERLIRYGGWIGKLAGCPLCMSVWLGLGCTVAYEQGRLGRWLVTGIAASAAALFLNAIWARIGR